MRDRYLIYIFLAIILLSCQKPRESRINYLGYEVGQKIDTNWTVLSEDEESKSKYLQHRIDSNFTCSTIADTIWSMIVFNLNKKEVIRLRESINNLLTITSDCTHYPKSIGRFESYEYNWVDSAYKDKINLISVKMNPKREFGSWSLEISNDSLNNYLNSSHDPYYHLKPPSMNE